MTALGVHFALTEAEVAALRACPDLLSRLALLREELEDRYFEDHEEHLAETEKAWDSIHRVLSDGSLLPDAGVYPQTHAVVGGQQLSDDPDEIMSLKTAAQVRDIAQALLQIDEAEFRRRYANLDERDFGRAFSEEEAEGAWEYFEHLRDFYQHAAASGRPVLFTVSL